MPRSVTADACLARSITKPHSRYQRGNLGELISVLVEEETVRGECTLLIAGAPDQLGAVETRTATDAAALLLREGAPPRAVVALLTSVFGLPRRRAYELAHPSMSDT